MTDESVLPPLPPPPPPNDPRPSFDSPWKLIREWKARHPDAGGG